MADVKKTVEIDVQVKGEGALTEVTQSTKMLGDASSGAGGKLGMFSGALEKLAPGLSSATSSSLSFGKSLWALVANPIGVIITGIVAGFTLLYKAFTATADGADKISFIFEGVSKAVESLFGSILEFASGLAAVLSGDVISGLSKMKNAVVNAGGGMVDAAKAGYAMAESLDNIEDRLKELEVTQSKNNSLLKKSRELINDENATYADKKKAIAEIRKVEAEYAKEQEALLAARVAILQADYDIAAKRGNLSQKQIDDLQKAQIELNKSVEENTGKRIAINKQELKADKDNEAAIKEEADKRKELKKKRDDEAAAAQKIRDDEEKKRLKLRGDFINTAAITELKNEFDRNDEKIRQDKQAKAQEIDSLKISNEQKKELLRLLDKQVDAQYDANNEARKKKKAEDNAKEQDAEQKKQDAILAKFIKRLDEQQKKKQDRIAQQPELAREAELNAMSEYDRELSLLEETYIKKLEIAAGNEALIFALNRDWGAKKLKLKQSEKKEELNAYMSAAGSIAEIVGKETLAGKAIAIAQATINTYTAAAQVFARPTPGIAPVSLAVKIASMAAALAAGFATVKGIVATKVPGGGGGSGSGGGEAVAPPAASFNIVGASTNNQLASSIAGSQGTPINAYVVGSHVTSQQSLDRQRINNATFI